MISSNMIQALLSDKLWQIYPHLLTEVWDVILQNSLELASAKKS